MPSFDEKNAYQEKGEVFFDDGREVELLHYVYRKPNVDTEIRNNPSAVLRAIDDYARTQKYLMNVGEDKGRIVCDLIASVKPTTMVELGGYVGYSCILFGEAVRKAGGERYYSLERNPEFAAVIASLVDLAGLSNVVKVVVGSSDASIKRLHEEGVLKKIDLMFLDHYKPAYTTDLKLCEELGLVGVGSVYAADNCIEPGNPPYLEYVRSSVQEKKQKLKEQQEKGESDGQWDSRMKASSMNQYLKREGTTQMDTSVKGRPGLVYESDMHYSYEPTGEQDGVEITRCTGEES